MKRQKRYPYKHFLVILVLYIITTAPVSFGLKYVTDSINPVENWPIWLSVILAVGLSILSWMWMRTIEKHYLRLLYRKKSE
jgi:amino acid transporter